MWLAIEEMTFTYKLGTQHWPEKMACLNCELEALWRLSFSSREPGK